MKAGIASALVAGAFLIDSWSVVAAQQLRPPTRMEVQAFHACLYTAYVQDYCRRRTFYIPDGGLSYRECVVANSAHQIEPVGGSLWGASIFVREACWAQIQGDRH